MKANMTINLNLVSLIHVNCLKKQKQKQKS